MGLSELSRMLMLPKATTFRIAETLAGEIKYCLSTYLNNSKEASYDENEKNNGNWSGNVDFRIGSGRR
ncbi:helix-turn-helix domain-containing protein [Priestia endophytica]|uniref:helix-turn-helix domain-containing protein n=1 Tax=Priestia endophytica TaxID=135735 RepID=UPI003AF228AA